MCLAIPAQIEKMDGQRGTVVLDGSRMQVILALVPEAKVGDWVLIHAGYAITTLDAEEAKKTYDLLREAGV
jgi:hydrogenase expression/formation protein HypC